MHHIASKGLQHLVFYEPDLQQSFHIGLYETELIAWFVFEGELDDEDIVGEY